MSHFVRRLRGALGLATTWGAAWAAISVAFALALGIARPEEIAAGEGPAQVAVVLGLAGFLAGLGFAAFLLLCEKRRTIHALSLGRVALWGFLGAAAVPVLLGADIGEGWITGTLGAIFAAASLALARRRVSRGASPSIPVH